MKVLESQHLMKVKGILWLERQDHKSIIIVRRVVEWREDEFWWETDPRHVERILTTCGMTSGHSSAVPWAKPAEENEDAEDLSQEDVRKYRSAEATANYIAQDRPDVRFAVKALCRSKGKRTGGSWRKLKTGGAVREGTA